MYFYKEKHSPSSLFSKPDIVSVEKSTLQNSNEDAFLHDTYVDMT